MRSAMLLRRGKRADMRDVKILRCYRHVFLTRFVQRRRHSCRRQKFAAHAFATARRSPLPLSYDAQRDIVMPSIAFFF